VSDVKEGFTDYLRRVADDHEDSGMEYTAKDYRNAARRIDELVHRLWLASKRLKVESGELLEASKRGAKW